MEQTQLQPQPQPNSPSQKSHFTLSADIFSQPELDIHSQMMYIVMSSYIAESTRPGLPELAQRGRMNEKEATGALQRLAELQLIPHRVFRQLVGEFRDDRLSWAAKGLLLYVKEHSVAGIGQLLELCGRSGEDEQSVRRALGELKRAGYLEEHPELERLATA